MPNEQLLRIPAELWEKVFTELDLKDIKSVRLAWRGWVSTSSRSLFQPFVFRVDRRDLERFDFITNRTSLSKGIDSLRFEIGTINIADMSFILGYEYASRYEEPYTTAELEEKAATLQYAAWNVRWHDSKQKYNDTTTLRAVFSQLKTLNRLEIVYRATPFTTDLLLGCWGYGSWPVNMKKHSMEFVAMLLVLQGTHLQLKHLSHDQLPVAFFTLDDSHLANYTMPLRNLNSLRLTFDATDTPRTAFWHGLGTFLQAIPNLRDLRFGFAPFEHCIIDGGTWQGSEDPKGWYVPLWKMLGGHTWKRLERLRLDGLVICEAGFSELLTRHAQTLKHLSLFNIGLWQGSFQGLLSNLRGVLSLKSFHVWGIIRSFHAPNESWKFDPRLELDV
jgi:hypothetical protein